MIVTCESCQAKYKLDDAKITGRGAKITCPKCRHVFVVYTPGAQPAAPAVATPPRPAPPPPTASPPVPAAAPDPGEDEPSWQEEEPTRIGMTTVPPPTGRPGLAGLAAAHLDVPRRSNPTLALPEQGEHNVAFLPPPPPTNAVTVSPAAYGDAAVRAPNLDFKKVGVATWKVKVKPGLIYDFSDIKTLRKYIQDGRVSSADSISYDGRAWKPLGDIPDLDIFFVETWERLSRQRAEQAAPVAPEMPPPSRPVGMMAATPAPEAPRRVEETAKSAAEPNQFRDPFEELKSKQRERVAGKRPMVAEPTSSGTSPLVVVGVILLLAAVGGGGWYFWSQQNTGSPARAVPTGTISTPSPGQPDIREQIQNQIKEGMEKVPDADPATPPDPHELTPVRPTTVPSTPVRTDTRPAAANGQTTGKSGQVINTSDATATDHEAIGDASARAGDWAGAVKAYSNAVSLDPKNGRLLKKLGEAQSKAGDKDAAAETLKRAAAEGQRDAYKLLGNIAREQGDTSNAVYQYQLYLAGHPKDAADIERLIQEMSGGG